MTIEDLYKYSWTELAEIVLYKSNTIEVQEKQIEKLKRKINNMKNIHKEYKQAIIHDND